MRVESRPTPKVLIIGGGVAGLNTALRLMEDLQGNCLLTIKAEKFSPNTTSNVAAGLFRPSSHFQGPTKELTDFWLSESWKFYHDLRKRLSPKEHGIFELPVYLFASKYPEATRNDFFQKHSHCHRPCQEAELNLVQPKGKWKYGTYSHTILTDCDIYMPWAMRTLTARGVQFVEGRVDSFAQLLDSDYDVVVNCTGFGAKALCNDIHLVANRGQVFKVKAPWIKMAFYGDFDTYVIPGMNYVTLGGTRQYGNQNDDVDDTDSAAIWSKVTTMMPNLAKAEVISECVAWRPTRKFVRVEKEVLFNGRLKVVHHYGHCGYGVMSSPGSALTAVELVKEMLAGNTA